MLRLAIPTVRPMVPIVATDATIAVNFTNPVSNDMGVGPDTYGAIGDAGVQTVQDLTLRYGLQSIAVRRSPRFGPGAGTWTDFVMEPTPHSTCRERSTPPRRCRSSGMWMSVPRAR